MATSRTSKQKEEASSFYEWTGKDRRGKPLKGELRARGEAAVAAQLRRQGIFVTKVRKRRISAGRKIKPMDIMIFTRQFATMMKAGIPLLQSFDIVGQGHPNPSMSRLLESIRKDIETGTSMANAFRKHPAQFDTLYCNLVEAGETAGILESLLDRLAIYQEKTENLKRKIKSALMYPTIILIAVVVVVAIMMIFVIPTFKQVFEDMGAQLPAPTLVIMNISDFFVNYWYIIFGAMFAGGYFIIQSYKRSEKLQNRMDQFMLQMPIFGPLVQKSVLARWTRTLATMFSAGVPLVDSLNSVGGASGNAVYKNATRLIQQDVTSGTSLTIAMSSTKIFPSIVLQMTSIGEESGSLDSMLNNVADFYEDEVDEAVKGISTMIEPIIIVLLGVVVGGMVVAMYLPIFSMGQNS